MVNIIISKKEKTENLQVRIPCQVRTVKVFTEDTVGTLCPMSPLMECRDGTPSGTRSSMTPAENKILSWIGHQIFPPEEVGLINRSSSRGGFGKGEKIRSFPQNRFFINRSAL
ncbi:hypothetical protein NPIL_419831 [Nephila pilipes]|uniref:Uncharacterized protein n=1 Tax=Nephila pilipes TaxID=299642 RepID=A0A8X6MDH1_NEPPI|nr:hypothetical protein NPIL_250811 [Nephila pilipes]GFT35796.1 hypothetical protein NPIL_41931 [Nephila pilipes]GFT94678.1 hypothetical protein NPIL_506331 [Nephila pilipes]GFU28133.1 hypothetical protein NPIL_419831 [Nephila pilipes]